MKIKKIAAFLSAAAMACSALGLPVTASESSGKSVADMVAAMSTEQKIEQMIMITLRPWATDSGYQNVTSLNKEQRKLITDHNFAGVCLFAPNIRSVEQTVALTTEIQQAALDSECGIPMLISADQEGGSIYRLTTGTPTCGNMALGATNDPSLAEENAKILGSEIMSLGINTDLAPVVDVNNNPSNPVINIRSFSSDPELVSEMAESYIRGLQNEGVITTCKHFPGHGDTGVDSHTGLPLIDKSYDELKELELVPYATVTDDTDMIMTAHIQFPQIEKGTYTSIFNGEQINIPATLSKTMITDVLRRDYGFDGVVTTDSMMMAAIQQNFDLIDSATLAINADVDIILEPMYIQSTEDIAKLEQYIKDIAKQVEDGKISIDTIDRSVTRILTMKQERGVLDYTAPDAETAKQIVGSAEHREKALETAEKAVTLVKNDDDLLPLKLEDDAKVAYFYPYSNVENTIYFALDRLKKGGVVPDSITTDCICHQGHDAAEFEENVKNCDVVILAFEMYSAANLDKTNEARGWQARFADDLIELAHANDKKVVYLSANIPYDVARFQEADAMVAAYNADGMNDLPVDGKENSAYGVNYPAALLNIFGGNDPTGKLPVDVYAVDDNSQYTDEILYEQGFDLEYVSENAGKIDITDSIITVDTAAKTVSVTVDGKTVPSSEYHVVYFTYEKTENGDSLTRVGTDFPTEPGTYIAGVVANEDSEDYIGENRSEPFTIAAGKTDISDGTVTVDTAKKSVTVTVDGKTVPSSEYHVIYFTYEKTEEGESLTRVGTDFPTKDGTYIAGVVANEDSASYTGENRSEPFTITAPESDSSAADSSSSSADSSSQAAGSANIANGGDVNPSTGAGISFATAAILLGAAAATIGRKKKD
ncbi:MAG: glycoside hydrolase family 3 C-terminal domain-containing protein [Ruminococcus sp.]|nr:glycoside hydrolase family 3 C-terminal domain-containing protein [Ruminococcus sp.]